MPQKEMGNDSTEKSAILQVVRGTPSCSELSKTGTEMDEEIQDAPIVILNQRLRGQSSTGRKVGGGRGMPTSDDEVGDGEVVV